MNIINQLGLRKRECPLGSGVFSYVDYKRKRRIEFRWDNAGLDRNGKIILIEEELGTIVNLHIHGHLSRLRIMVKNGEKVSKLVWIINRYHYHRIKETIDDWIILSGSENDINFPKMEYRTKSGDILFINNISPTNPPPHISSAS